MFVGEIIAEVYTKQRTRYKSYFNIFKKFQRTKIRHERPELNKGEKTVNFAFHCSQVRAVSAANNSQMPQ